MLRSLRVRGEQVELKREGDRERERGRRRARDRACLCVRQVATGRDKAKCLFGAFAWGTVVVATSSVVVVVVAAAAARVVAVVVIVAVIRRIHKLVLIIAQMRMSEWEKLISQLHFATHFIVDGVVGGWQRAEGDGRRRRGRGRCRETT